MEPLRVHELAPPPVGEGSLTPHLAVGEASPPVLSWLEPVEGAGPTGASTRAGTYRLRVARLDGEAWGEPATVVESDRFFVNWADFPGVEVLADGRLVAHWLERGGQGTYDYAVRVARETDGGWSEPWTPHEDRSPTEHGFVSTEASEDGYVMAWLDGRNTGDHGHGTGMSLHGRSVAEDGSGVDVELDALTCDCCQTDMAWTERGPVVVYRDRSPEEVRDIALVRRRPDGTWTEPRLVHQDGWTIAACPVNGPAVAARGSRVVVAWFTAPADEPRVLVAFSEDGGDSFGPPHRLDGGEPVGRVDVVLDAGGTALVTWVEDVGAEQAEIRAVRVAPAGPLGEEVVVAETRSARASGFPRAVAQDGGALIAWTDDAAGRVRTARLEWGAPR
ncbi:MAG: exo-alpha-sialidase [Gemmatimonadetes bacterium]|nr:exo-alpha-sialidase [Gemmatimonadota bacterium]